jgi:hypothetical protein
MPLYSAPEPEWMTEADKLMLHIGKEPVQWDDFSARLKDRGEMDVGGVEMRCFEDYTLPPRPDNDVIVAAVLVPCKSSMVSVLKQIGMADWPVGHSTYALDCPHRSFPDGCHV